MDNPFPLDTSIFQTNDLCYILYDKLSTIDDLDELIEIINASNELDPTIDNWIYLLRNINDSDCINSIVETLDKLKDWKDKNNPYPINSINIIDNLEDNTTYALLSYNSIRDLTLPVLYAFQLGASPLETLINGKSIYDRLEFVDSKSNSEVLSRDEYGSIKENRPHSYSVFLKRYRNLKDNYRSRIDAAIEIAKKNKPKTRRVSLSSVDSNPSINKQMIRNASTRAVKPKPEEILFPNINWDDIHFGEKAKNGKITKSSICSNLDKIIKKYWESGKKEISNENLVRLVNIKICYNKNDSHYIRYNIQKSKFFINGCKSTILGELVKQDCINEFKLISDELINRNIAFIDINNNDYYYNKLFGFNGDNFKKFNVLNKLKKWYESNSKMITEDDYAKYLTYYLKMCYRVYVYNNQPDRVAGYIMELERIFKSNLKIIKAIKDTNIIR